MRTIKILILASLEGTNFEAIINNFKAKNGGNTYLNLKNGANIKKLKLKFIFATNNKYSKAKYKSKRLGIENYNVDNKHLDNFIDKYEIDLVILAGYMKIIQKNALNKAVFLNIHPSILPKYKGKDALIRAYRNKEKEYGITIHFVNSIIDGGEIIDQKSFKANCNMSYYEIKNKIHKIEHKTYSNIIKKVICEKFF